MDWEMLKDYLLLNVNEYFDNVDFPINLFIIAITIGLCIASFCITVHKRYTARLLSGLIRHGAKDEKTAVSLERMHITPSSPLKAALLRHGQLTEMVAMVDTEGEVNKSNVHTVGLYLKPDKMTRAQRISEGVTPSYVGTAVFCFVFLTIAVALAILMPEILSFLSGL